ncbi:MAG: hypothetical protein K0Q79_722 [Flavipsychrobacter sp.]|jgi:hypothetical protein|nr:hypothetical protein [Flavipsychrobacter sp.]
METNDLKNTQNQETTNETENKVPESTEQNTEHGETHHKHQHNDAVLSASLGHSAVGHVHPTHRTRLEN